MIQEPVMEIHNHYYKVSSNVFSGAVTNSLFKLRDSSNPILAM